MSEKQAHALMQEAEKELNKFSLFSSKESKREAARDKFLKAATMYKASSNFQGAAMAYSRAAEMSQLNKEEIDLAEDWMNAGTYYLKVKDVQKGEELLGNVVDLYERSGKYGQAARACKQIGDEGTPNAEKWYARAIQYFRNEGSRVAANDLAIKIADMKVQHGEYDAAKDEYFRIAKGYTEETLTRGNAKKYFFLTLLCRIALVTPDNFMEGVEGVQQLFSEVQDLDPQFDKNTREHMLISALIIAFEEEDLEKWVDAVNDYDSIIPLDQPRQKMLMRGKHAIIKRKDDGSR